MILELLKAFMLIFIAEMGDKTQILAMAFATRYPVKKVLLGIFLGVLFNHGLAVIIGSYISNHIPLKSIQIVAGIAFVGFSLWTLKSNEDEEHSNKENSKFGPVITVAAAFFVGELGDKTQLTAITLATSSKYPLGILAGTILGMIATGGIGIFIGKKLGDKIPELTIKILTASIFMLFGVTKLYLNLPDSYINTSSIALFFSIIIFMIFLLIRPMIVRRQAGYQSVLVKTSKELFEYYKHAEKNLSNICLGENYCGRCQGNDCIVGYTKSLIEQSLNNNTKVLEPFKNDTSIYKPFSKQQAMDCLVLTLTILKDDPDNSKYKNINEIRKNLETILFGKCIDKITNWSQYTNNLVNIDEAIASTLLIDL